MRLSQLTFAYFLVTIFIDCHENLHCRLKALITHGRASRAALLSLQAEGRIDEGTPIGRDLISLESCTYSLEYVCVFLQVLFYRAPQT